MKRWAITWTLSPLICFSGVSEAAHQLSDTLHPAQATTPERIQQAEVSVEAHPLDPEETLDIFEVDLISKGIQPHVIKIRNESQQTYRFAKTNVDAHYIPAATAAKAAFENLVLIGGKAIGEAVSAIPRWIFPLHRNAPHRTSLSRPVLNREVQASFVKEEIPDREIGPRGSLAGFMFLRPRSPGHSITITLVNAQTQTALIFEIQTPSPPTQAAR